MISNINELLRYDGDITDGAYEHNICHGVNCVNCTMYVTTDERVCSDGRIGELWKKLYHSRENKDYFACMCALIGLKAGLENIYENI